MENNGEEKSLLWNILKKEYPLLKLKHKSKDEEYTINEIEEIKLKEKKQKFLEDYFDENGYNVLHLATRQGKEKVVKMLLNEKMIDVNSQTNNKDGDTALHIAVKYHQKDVIIVLLKANADIDLENNKGFKPLKCNLFDAATYNDSSCLLDLLQHDDIDMEVKDQDGNTPLLSAVKKGRLSNVILLIKNGANVNVVDNKNNGILANVCIYGHLDILKRLHELKIVDINEPLYNYTPLMFACKNNHINIVEFLINEGIDVNIATKQGLTASHSAAESGNLDILNILIDNSANVVVKANDSYSPLLLAVQNKRYEIINRLLEVSNEIDRVSFGMTFFFSDLEMVQLFLKHKRYNLTNGVINVLTQFCCNVLVFKYLFEQKFLLINWKGNNQNLLHRVILGNQKSQFNEIENEYLNIYNLFEKGNLKDLESYEQTNPIHATDRFDYGFSALHLAVITKNRQFLLHFIKRGFNVNVTDKKNETPLHHAARDFNYDILSDLIKAGANLNARNKLKNMAIHISCYEGNIKCVELLLKASNFAQINEKGYQSDTLLHIALEKNHIHLVHYLLEYNVDINHKNKFGASILDFHYKMKQEVISSLFHFCVRQNSFHNLHILLMRAPSILKSQINEFYHDGFTPLLYACMNGFYLVVLLLLNAKANVSISSPLTGDSPLSLAVSNDFYLIVDMLLYYGADPFSEKVDGECPIDLAKSEKMKTLLSDQNLTRINRMKRIFSFFNIKV